jgi:hypothetical protein
MVPQIKVPDWIFLSSFLFFLILSGLSTYALAAGELTADPVAIRKAVEQKTLDDAMLAFDSGDYMRARVTFEVLNETAQSPEISRQALFGLASVDLILAVTAEEYEAALRLWERWVSKAGARLEIEDPRMITPFLRRLEPAIHAGGMSGKDQRDRKIDFKGMLQTKAKEVESLRTKLDQRDREIRRLRHQLESLEEIHRKYQEKKQEATP